jgi:DNA repair exonuclease SbcCD ATPase subunit
MDHYRLSDELRQQLLENAAWGKAGVTRLDEKKDCASGESDGGYEKPAKAKKAKKKEMEDHSEYEDAEGSEELEEMAHVCPLCTSHLDEAIDEERILEHLNVVVGLVDRLTQLQEGEEDIESVIDETLAELLFQDLEEE